MTQSARWFDGSSAVERSVMVSRSNGRLSLSDDLGVLGEVAPAALFRLPSSGDEVRLGHRDIEGWRLILTPPVGGSLSDMLPKGGIVPTGRSRAFLGGLLAISGAVSALLAMVIFAPGVVARFMPFTLERKLGAAFDVPIEYARCESPAAKAALEKIVDRIDPRARADGFSIELLDVDEANAAALPGGRMIIFNGLFEDAADPDAIAGILAHEIAHVRRRHVAEAMVRHMGLGTLVTLLGGGAVASNVGGLLDIRFTRNDEGQADSDAAATLARAGIDPRPTARAFDHFRKMEQGIPAWLNDHPPSAERARLFRSSFRPDVQYRPVLDAQARANLMNACRSPERRVK